MDSDPTAASLALQLEERTGQLLEAREHLAAISEVLRAMSAAPADLQPVLDTVAEKCARLCKAECGHVFHIEAGVLRPVASYGPIATLVPEGIPVDRESVTGRAVVERRLVHVHDLAAEPDSEYPKGRAYSRRYGNRTTVAAPLMREGVPIGALTVFGTAVRPFSDRQMALLQAFADQAAIAIEDVRLLGELSQSLERQTATAEVLRILSRSPNDARLVFESIATAAMRLCGAQSANVFTFDGSLLHTACLKTAYAEAEEVVRRLFPRPPDRGSAASRAVLERTAVAIHDVLEDPDYAFPDGSRLGFRSVLGVPLMRDGEPIGAIAIGKPEPGPFRPEQVALVQTFADQAVIAIEDQRMFQALDARTAELTRSVAELRALGEVGRAVGSTLDLEHVLRTIVSRATGLADADGGAISEYDERTQEFHLRTADRLPEELVEALAATPMRRGEGVVGRVAVTCEPVGVPDIVEEGVYQSRVRELLLRLGFRSLLAVPLLHENRVLGGLVVLSRRAGEFRPRLIDLLKNFATHSALAIHNARLFRELQEKSRQLEIASRHKSAFLANMSHELRTPLNAIIGFTRIVMRRSREQLESKQLENLDKILASAQHLLALINAILDLAKVEAGKVELCAAELALAPVLEQCLRTAEPLVRDGVALQGAFDADLPPIWADAEKLRQIIINLLSNAAKFTAAGKIRLGARADGDWVEIVVSDTGIGIPADKLETIFEEFEQVDARVVRDHGGTGLGLAISRRLARLMGGELSAESAFGSGSTFRMRLPARMPMVGR